jgi:2-octaprenyl-6-methoxyphenol hydroxylase
VLRIGNAAQTLHPVAGQGFNLGLRDAWELAEAITGCSDIASLGEAAFCQRYLASRHSDRRLIVGLTDGLARGFLAQAAPLPALRGLGLAALNGLGPLRNSFARRLMHGWRALP